MSVINKLLPWGAALSWVGFTAYYISTAKMKLTVKDLLLMMPQCCEMTDLVSDGYIVFAPETMIKFCIGFILLHFVTWWVTAEEVVEKSDNHISLLEKCVREEIVSKKEIEKVLLDSAESMLDNMDMEFEHCVALIGSNNETPGQRVGGEVEWATGETSSEDEDATREVIGAHIKKPNEDEEEKLLRCLTYPNDNFDDDKSKISEKEPHLISHISDDEGSVQTDTQSWPFRELEVE